MQPQPRTAPWRSTPPAVFPPVLGLAGLALAWQRAAEVFAVPRGIGDLILGASLVIFTALTVSYLTKFINRRGVLVEDLRILPGRAGLPAATMTAMVLAAELVPIAPGAARALLWAGLAAHGALALCVIAVLATNPPGQRGVTPARHLSFVGFIVVPLAALPLGLDTLARLAFGGTAIVAAGILAVSLAQILRARPPAPFCNGGGFDTSCCSISTADFPLPIHHVANCCKSCVCVCVCVCVFRVPCRHMGLHVVNWRCVFLDA